MSFPIPINEQQRLQVLQRYDVLGTPPERTFDRIVNLCIRLFNVPMALVTFVETDRQWHKACYGIKDRELDREISFCAYAILSDTVMIVPDAQLDARFAANPLVTGNPHIRFYAGAPLRTATGEHLGTLCIIDTVPRQLSLEEQATLMELADVVVDELDLRLAIRERQTAMAARHESEERFRSAFNESAIGMALVGRDGQWLQVNRALCTIVGYNSDELLATNFQAITHPDDLDADLSYIRRMLSSDLNSYEMEKRYFHKTGFVVWVLLSVSLVKDEHGHILYFIAQVQDITERKQAQATLQATQAQLRHLLTVTPTVIYSCRPLENFRTTFVSDNVLVQTGYSPQAFLEHDDFWQSRLHPDDALHIKATESLILEPGQHSREYRFQHKDGRYCWIHDTATLVQAEDGSWELVGSWLDVTERKQAEAQLQLQRDFALQVMNTMGQGLTVTNANGEFTFVNPAFGAMLGYEPHRLLGKRLQDLFAAGQPVANVFDATQPSMDMSVTYERALQHIDGRTVHGLITAQRCWSTEPINGSIKVITDLTERKQAEAALKKSEARYRIVAETATDVIMTIDEHSTILYVNRAAQKVFGYEPHELVGQHITLLMPEQYQDMHVHGLGHYIRTSQRQISSEAVEVSGVHRDGRMIALEISFGEHSLINEHSFTAIVRDVSERKRTEVALRRSETRFRTVVESLGEGLLITDLNDVILYANTRVADLVGYQVDELVGHVAYKILLPAEQWSNLLIRHQQRKCNVAERYEIQLRHNNGNLIWVEVNATPYCNDEGEIVGTLGALTDITERKQIARELQRAKDEAEAANRAKSEFLSRMSHELRTPLNAILGFAQLMHLSPMSPDDNENMEFIIKAGRHLLALINDVLDISRIETGKLVFSMQSVNVSAAVQAAFEIVTPLATESHVQLIHDLNGNDWFVLADEHRFQQVLINLHTNAIKYNREHGTVHVSYAVTAEKYLRLNVRDTGWGIPVDKLERLFTTFDRLGAEHTTVEGTGIGLALTKWLVQAMGGRIGVESEPGHGSTFWVEFPLISHSAVARSLTPIAQFARANEQRAVTVLYIEDNLSNLRLVERVLAKHSEHQLLTATDGATGLALVAAERPDIILLDLHLPDMTGTQVLQHLRRDQALSNIPVIVLSADALPDQVDELLATGVSAYVTKPFDVPAFLECLTRTLKESVPQ